RADQLVVMEDVAARDTPFAQQAAEDGLVDAELFLDRSRRQAHLPPNLRDAPRAAPVDQGELDVVGVVLLEAVPPRVGKVLPTLSCLPELAHRSLERCLVHPYFSSRCSISTASRARRSVNIGDGAPCRKGPALPSCASLAYDLAMTTANPNPASD